MKKEINRVINIFTNYRILKLRILLRIFGIKISKTKLLELVETQTEKGLLKYNRTILDCLNSAYNWNIMAAEEIIDFYLYTLKNKNKI